MSFAGNTGRSYNMYVDGVDNKEDQDGGTLVQLSLDGIEEFRALGAGFQAEYGRGSTVVVLASKSGTNRFRGTGLSVRPQRIADRHRLLLEAREWWAGRTAVHADAVRRIVRRAAGP